MSSEETDSSNMRSTSPKPIYLLHVTAGCNSTVSMETAKYLMDSGQCGVNDREPQDFLTPLHVAASWDNLLMCQLLVHYGADLMALSRDKYSPADLAKGSSRDFLRGLAKRGEKRKQRKILKFLRYLFQAHKSKKSPPTTIPRSASLATAGTPQPPALSLNQQIDDYLLNPDQHNARFSATRFSGFSTVMGATASSSGQEKTSGQEANLSAMNKEKDQNGRTSSLCYKTANEEFDQRVVMEKQEISSAIELFHSLPFFPVSIPNSRTSPFLKLQNLRELKPTIHRFSTTIHFLNSLSLTPLITIRRNKQKPPSTANTTPAAIPRSTSLLAALQPNDIPRFDEDQKTFESTKSEESQDEKSPEVDPIFEDLIKKAANLSLDQLRENLLLHVFSPGPMDKTNRRHYERKLAQLELDALRGVEMDMKRKQMGLIYNVHLLPSIPLERLVKADEWDEKLLIGFLEEQIIQAEFANPPGKDEISFFCYLLIDAIDLLPNPSFRDFLRAIFYIGKGKRSRPLQHFADTVKYRTGAGKGSNKIEHICRVWVHGMGVVSLHLFNNIHSAEALIREAAMIEAMTLDNIDNEKRGTFSGSSKQWTRQRQAEFGAFLLKKAYIIYQNVFRCCSFSC